MATVTDPIILDSTGQDIKTSIDLLTANINRTASNIPYDNNLTIKGKIDAIDLTEGGTVGGNINIDNAGADSYLVVGNNKNAGETGKSRSILRLFGKNQYSHWIYNDNVTLTADRHIELPNKAGTIALTSDDDWTSIAQGTTSADISGTSYKEYHVVILVQSISPNVCYNLHLYRGMNLLSGNLKYKLGDWANQSYGSSIEITANTSSIVLNSAYLNGSNVLSNTKMYISGRH